MGEKIANPPELESVPPVPLQTYRWEDIRRQKLEGSYPWTHLYKTPFDVNNWESQIGHEYEPVTPMDQKNLSLPVVKVTDEIKESKEEKLTDDREQNKHCLQIPAADDDENDSGGSDGSDEESDDSDDDNPPSEEITAQVFQSRLEQRFFNTTPSTSDYDVSKAESCKSDDYGSTSKHEERESFVQMQADKIKAKFKHFREQQAKHNSEKEESKSLKEKFKFNIKKPSLPDTSKIHLPSVPSFHLPNKPNLSFLTRSRSNSVKETESIQKSKLTEPKKKFEFGTYPRVFRKKKKSISNDDYEQIGPSKPISKSKTESAPNTPSLGQKLLNKLKDFKHTDEKGRESVEKQREPKQSETEVKSSILVSLRDNQPKESKEKKQTTFKVEEPEEKPTKMIIDNKNFFFISLHEDRPDLPPRWSDNAHKNDLNIDTNDGCKNEVVIVSELLKDFEKKDHVSDEEASLKKEKMRKFLNKSKSESLWNFALRNKENIKLKVPGSSDSKTSKESLSGFSDSSFQEAVVLNEDESKTIRKSISILSSEGPTNGPAPRIENDKNQTLQSIENVEIKALPIVTVAEIQTHPYQLVKNEKRLLRSLDNVSTKESFASSIDEINTNPFEEYDSALEKNKMSSDYYSAVEMGKKYSSENSLANIGLNDDPNPPVRPKRVRTIQRNKKRNHDISDNKTVENADTTDAYNTFPMIKPNKPRRRFKKRRKFSTSTVASNPESQIYIENDESLNRNIANSKQLSVSFLPLSSNVVDDNISCYDLRETSSMIHLNITEQAPIPPKRKKSYSKDTMDRNHLYTQKYGSSKSSLNRPISPSMLHNNIRGCEVEYADYNSLKVSECEEPPTRPGRKHSTGNFLALEDDVSRTVESSISYRSEADRSLSCDIDDQQEKNGYAVVGKSSTTGDSSSRQQVKRTSSNVSEKHESSFKNKMRRLSDFFTLPRIAPRENYILPISATLDRKVPQSPSRPPRRNKVFEHVYTEDEISDNRVHNLEFCFEKFGEDSKSDETQENISFTSEDIKNLRSGDILEKMKDRPLPPPPRPLRKTKGDDEPDEKKNITDEYSQCIKKINRNEISINYMQQNKEKSVERKIINIGYDPMPKLPQRDDISVGVQTDTFLENDVNKVSDHSTDMNKNLHSSVTNLKLVTADTFQVSELNVGKLTISDIESCKLVTSSIDSMSLNISDINHNAGNLSGNNLEENSFTYHVCDEKEEENGNICDKKCVTNPEQYPKSMQADTDSLKSCNARSRISSMIPEVGSDEEQMVIPPSRKRHGQKRSKSRSIPDIKETRDVSPSLGNKAATLSELTYQIFQICQSNIGQAIHAMIEQLIPENREKRNEVQAAIWIITIIVAGCLVLGLGSEKTVHHHHWDFHFPPPH